jgi:hypothetical protein
VLILVGNPLKTIRQQHFLEFVRKNVGHNVRQFLSLPAPRGKVKAALPLSTPEIRSAAAKSRSQLRLALEAVLSRLSEHNFVSYSIVHGGNDVST